MEQNNDQDKSNFERTEIVVNMCSAYNGMKLGINKIMYLEKAQMLRKIINLHLNTHGSNKSTSLFSNVGEYVDQLQLSYFSGKQLKWYNHVIKYFSSFFFFFFNRGKHTPAF